MSSDNLLVVKDGLENTNSFQSFQQIASYFPDLQFYVAGSAIRKFIRGSYNEVKDIDVFVKFDKYKFEVFNTFLSELSKFGLLEYGQYGSPRWKPIQNNNIYYDIVPFENFDVGLGSSNTIEDLLKKFDLTINAIGFDIFRNKIYDPVGGLSDLDNEFFKAIRFDFSSELVSDEIPISKLSVLWFRYVHYASKLGFEIESNTLEWMSKNKKYINDIELFEKFFFKPFMSEKIISKL